MDHNEVLKRLSDYEKDLRKQWRAVCVEAEKNPIFVPIKNKLEGEMNGIYIATTILMHQVRIGKKPKTQQIPLDTVGSITDKEIVF